MCHTITFQSKNNIKIHTLRSEWVGKKSVFGTLDYLSHILKHLCKNLLNILFYNNYKKS